jgi:hypothetical protein
VEVAGRPWSIKGRESSLENQVFSRLLDVYGASGRLRTSLDGSPGRIPNRPQVLDI